MNSELNSINIKSRKHVTRDSWIIAAIKKLEKRNGIIRELPLDQFSEFPSSASVRKLKNRMSDDVNNSTLSNRDMKSFSYSSNFLENSGIFKTDKQGTSGTYSTSFDRNYVASLFLTFNMI